MFRNSQFEKHLENATSHLRLEPDWPSILLICDEIRQNDISAKHAFQSIKKKMNSSNPHTAFYALLLLESVVKNCGAPIHEEIATKENCEMFTNFIENTPHDNVRNKLLELIQAWSYAFRFLDKYQAVKDTITILKTKGYKFPELKEADAMFTADTAPNWEDGKVCHRCRVEFSFTLRKHHCRNCGQVFCAQCSAKQCPLPKFGIEKEVRVCDGCFIQIQKPKTGKTRLSDSNDLPAEYLTSSLAQQAQTPQRKTEQELKEEEELQLALALSQSEAEQKSKTTTAYKMYTKSPSPEAPPPPTPTANVMPFDDTTSDPELAKYLNRSYWEQRKTTESPTSPSAPSPMPQSNNSIISKTIPEDPEIDDFALNMKSQVEIFVNRMKSNLSRGRSIWNDSSVQTLFMNLTSLHSKLLTYIKGMDDKRMWCEQLQDKLAQVKDSRAALDVLRQEHVEKLRRIAEEQERQRQLQMAHKLEIMRKKKQEYLQYQRQLAVQRIQEEEREMQMRQEQQKAHYRMGQNTFPFIPPGGSQGSPNHQPTPTGFPIYNTMPGTIPRYALPNQMLTTQHPTTMPPVPMPGMYVSNMTQIPNQISNLMVNQGQSIPVGQQNPLNTQLQQQNRQQTVVSNLPQQIQLDATRVTNSNHGNITIPMNTSTASVREVLLQQQQHTSSFPPNQMQGALPGVSNLTQGNINTNPNMASSLGTHHLGHQIQSGIQVQTYGREQHKEQTIKEESRNIPATSDVNSSQQSEESEEQPEEVSTAELISFD